MRHAAAVPHDHRRLGGKQTEQVDDPVPWRHEERQVVEPVLVNAPDQRAEDLEARRHADACPDLRALLARSFQRGEVEDREGQDTE